MLIKSVGKAFMLKNKEIKLTKPIPASLSICYRYELTWSLSPTWLTISNTRATEAVYDVANIYHRKNYVNQVVQAGTSALHCATSFHLVDDSKNMVPP